MTYESVRRVVSRHRTELTRWLARTLMFGAAAGAAVVTIHTPSPIVVRPAAEALVMPVAARSSAVPVAHLTRATTSAPSLATASVPEPPAPQWELADIQNPRVDTWVHRFTTSLKNDFTTALKRGSAFDSMISSKLAERNMPHELFYLAMIESEFKPTARSHASAVGLWQFMAGTARRFGLSVGRHADERTNPAKETDAALAYLTELHDRFGSWYLAAAAYNAGPGAVAGALRRATGKSKGTDADFYRIASRLPRETRDYVPKLIAAARVAKQNGA